MSNQTAASGLWVVPDSLELCGIGADVSTRIDVTYSRETIRRELLAAGEQLFEYAKAFELHSKWLALFPDDLSALADFAETHFTTGHFSEFSQRAATLLANTVYRPR